MADLAVSILDNIERNCDRNLAYLSRGIDVLTRSLPTNRDQKSVLREYGNRQFIRGVDVGRQRASMAYYPGADSGVLRGDWIRGTRSVTSVIREDLTTLCARSEYAYRTDAVTRRAVNILAAYLVGQGNKPIPAVKQRNGEPVEGVNRQLAEDWERFNDEGIRTGNQRVTVYQSQLLSAITMIVYGSCIKNIVRSRSGSLLPFAYQLLKPTRLDFSRDTWVDQENASVIGTTLHGMQLNAYGEAEGFWFQNESAMRRAENILLSFYPIEAEQYLGLPWLTPVLPPIFDRQQLVYDKLKQSRIGARLGYKAPATLQEGIEGLMETSSNGEQYFDLDFQGFVYSSDGDIKPIQITDPISNTFEPLIRLVVQEIALGLGFSYQMLSSDLKDANFTSGRMNKLVDSKFFRMLHKALVKLDHQPMWDKFVEWEALSGRLSRHGVGYAQYLSDPSYYNACYWLPKDGDEWLEPLKEAQSEILEMKSGKTTFEEICAKKGTNYRDVIRKHKECRDALVEAGLECYLPENISATAKITETTQKEIDNEDNE
jgi:lambda family phage portal protein